MIRGTQSFAARGTSQHRLAWTSKGEGSVCQTQSLSTGLRFIRRTVSSPLTSRALAVFQALIIAAFFAVAIAVPAQEAPPKNDQTPAQATPTSLSDELEGLRKRLAQLSAEVNRMRAEIARLDKYRQVDYTRDQITKEEDRIRALQKDLIELSARETPLRKRLDEIEAQQQPDRIERNLAGVGSTKPEEMREAVSRQLSIEKRQIQAQLDTIQTSRTRNQSFITNAEESIARLKRRLTELSNDRSR
jgi:peptidoglycan hydrolase CwlO-like protein